ncbi:MAE_28990/MAE_18760 family HEPN-like nuclease [Chromobacterium violaceum]|uniref:MAE_28990/MAE_18760 family HEPN-like nuclease n=1 Tax=Chromobacterium violaceum TaxID=536 RepID=UPI000B040C05|nr:MAE_28990/MAE_18760 family HEPN-like nuclease [Chromobacterium violaceum]
MARYTVAYSSFVSRLEEVEILRKFAAQKERKDPIILRGEINALSRGAIVLLSSHLEAYIKELGELALDSLHRNRVPRNNLTSAFFYHISKDIIDEMKDTSGPDKIGEKIFNFLNRDQFIWSRNGAFPDPIQSERFNKGFANPAYNKIKSYFGRFGYSEFQSDLSTKMRGDFHPAKNMVDHLVDVRNKIAHGDPSATKTPAEVNDIAILVKKFCKETDVVFSNWWRDKFCSIR